MSSGSTNAVRPTLWAVIESPSEVPPYVGPTPARPWPSHVRLHSGTSDELIALVVGQLLQYGHSATKPSSIAELLAKFPGVAPGGLTATDMRQSIYPSCCCGLETWHEWKDLLNHGTQPWLGHDPSPWVEAKGEQFLVWPDGGMGEAPTEGMHPVLFTNCELHRALDEVERDLAAFVDRLRTWCRTRSPEAADQLAARFQQAFIHLDGQQSEKRPVHT